MAAPREEPLRAVQATLAELTAVVEGARAMPMSASCVVNRTEVLGLLSALSGQLPEALASAQQVLADRQGVLEQGEREAARIVEDARQERLRVLAGTDVVHEAQEQADAVLARAREQAEALRAEVDEYVDAKLATFEVVLGKTLAAVGRGREKLAGRSELDELREPEARVG